MSWRPAWLKQLEEMGHPISPTLYTALTLTAKTAASLEQITVRGYADDGGEGNQTTKAAENTGWTQTVDENFVVRIEIRDTASGGINNASFLLQRNLNGAGWVDVDGVNGVVTPVTSANVTEDTTQTTDLLSGQTGNFLAGTYDEDDGIVNNGNAIDFVEGTQDHTEVAWVVQIVGADVSDGDTIQFRAIHSDGTLLGSGYAAGSLFDVTADTGAGGTPVAVLANNHIKQQI